MTSSRARHSKPWERRIEMFSKNDLALEFHSVYDSILSDGKTVAADDFRFILYENGSPMEHFISFTSTPLIGTDGEIFAVYTCSQDTTVKVVSTRRMTSVLTIGNFIGQAYDRPQFWRQLSRGCAQNESDLAFTVVYSFSQSSDGTDASSAGTDSTDDWQWSKAGSFGLPADFTGFPDQLDASMVDSLFIKDFHIALKTRQPLVLQIAQGNYPKILQDIPGPKTAATTCQTCVILPILPATKEDIYGFIILGANPLMSYDAAFKQYVSLLAQTCATSLASVLLLEDARRRAEAAQEWLNITTNQLAQTQQEVIAEASRFRSLAELAPVPMFRLDEHGDVLFANQQWIDVTGLQREQWGKISWMGMVHEADRDLTLAQWNRLSAGEPVHFEMRWAQDVSVREAMFISGEQVRGPTWTIAAARPELRSDGSVQGVVGCLTDISRHKWVEGFQERRVTEALEMKRQQETFMDMVSHEARNPLSVMMLCTESILTTLHEIADGMDQATTNKCHIDELSEAASTVMTCAQHQGRIIDDVLTLSKLDSSLLSICPVEVRPTDVITQAMNLFVLEASKSGIEMTSTVHHTYTDTNIECLKLDPNRLLQILINLLTNAIKFTQGETTKHITLTVSASSNRLTHSPSGVKYVPGQESEPAPHKSENIVYVAFEVADSGRGMSPEDLARLYARFTQAASPKTHVQYGSSGLGLFISKRLAHMLGGSIGVMSTNNEHYLCLLYCCTTLARTNEWRSILFCLSRHEGKIIFRHS